MVTSRSGGTPVKLLVRPSPYKGEGLRGFLLRVAEQNGCGHGVGLYGHLTGGHISQSLVSDSVIENVAEALQVPRAEIDAISSRRFDEKVKSRCLFFGNEIAVSHLRGSHPAVCPRCLAERRAVSGLWDLRAVCACPQHGSWLIDQCPRCGKSLKWNRGGVTRCHCGFDLAMAEAIPAPSDVLVLTSLLHEITLHDLPSHEEQLRGYPVEIRRTPLNEILGLFRFTTQFFLSSRGGQLAAGIEGSDSLARHGQAALLMATILRDWPSGLALALSGYGVTDPINAEASVVLTQREFDGRYGHLMRAAHAPQSACTRVPEFFKQALRQFRDDYCISKAGKGSFLNPSHASSDMDGRHVLKSSACYAALGLEVKDIGQDETIAFDQFLELKAREKRWSFPVRQVMGYLGCTRSQLDTFMMLGLLQSWAGNEFKEKDVIGFVRTLEKIAVGFERRELARRARLANLTSISSKHAESFAHLVNALIHKKIGLYKIHDRPAQSLADFYVSKIELKEQGYWSASGCRSRGA